MTMPHLMNCQHQDDGWCLQCVKEQHAEIERLQDQLDKLIRSCAEAIAMIRHNAGIDETL